VPKPAPRALSSKAGAGVGGRLGASLLILFLLLLVLALLRAVMGAYRPGVGVQAERRTSPFPVERGGAPSAPLGAASRRPLEALSLSLLVRRSSGFSKGVRLFCLLVV